MIENIPIIKSIIDLLVVIGKAVGKLFGRTPKSEVEAEIPKKTIKEEGDTFTADVAIIDQFGNEHWIKGIVFK